MVFYDFEVFTHDWLVVLIDIINRTEDVIHNDPKALEEYYTAHADDVWAGYNSRRYDQYILKAILCGIDPKAVNDKIITDKVPGYQISDLFNKIPLITYDCMTVMAGLKTLEAFMGHNIKETSVPFDIDRPLTEDELKETIKYCKHDVEETIEVWLRRKDDEFDAHISLLQAFNLPLSDLGRTKAQLSAKILGAVKQKHDDEFDIQTVDTLRLDGTEYEYIQRWYENPENANYNKYLSCNVAGVPHIFAWGGVHGAVPQYHGKGVFINVDVASFYPSLMLRYGLLSRNVHDPTKYADIYNTRLRLKAEKNPMQKPYKIVLNSTYGAMKDQYNNLYDPRQANLVCVNGQLLLLDLMEKMERSGCCEIIQSNTDGVLVKLRGDPDKAYQELDDVCWEWEHRTGMTLEFDEFSEVFQKDVNNYVIVAPDGSYKCKGIYVKKLNDLDNDLPIVNRAIINYFIDKIAPENTIKPSNVLKDFQRVVKVSSKYEYGIYGAKFQDVKWRRPQGDSVKIKRYIPDSGVILTDKTFRVFASKDPADGGIYKQSSKIVRGEKKNPEKFPATSEHCKIVNEDINNMAAPEWLDKDYYINLAWERLEDFGVKKYEPIQRIRPNAK